MTPSGSSEGAPPPDVAYLDLFLAEDPSLPTPDAVLGFVDEPTPDELRTARRLEAMSDEERLADIRRDPSLQGVVEAAEGMEPVASD